ncbi:MAG: PaaI family thioesterase [Myxococcales bacterium]|nr:MAG: PaaI family thioesterase [Myxococcales bacterium]
MSEAEIAAELALYGGLADAVRRLCDASVRTTVDETTVTEVTAVLNAAADRLEADRLDGSFGVSITTSGHGRTYGNAVVGVRNPVAVPLTITQHAEGRATAEFRLGATYEGPPGLVHGGVTALILDQLCGEAAAAGGAPGMTGTLNIRYRKGTPLGDCSAEAWIDRREGVKTFVKGVMRDNEGQDTVEAEGIFILPRWAREANASPKSFE